MNSRTEPDLLWVLPNRYLDRHPRSHEVLLCIEACHSSLRYDCGEKTTLYAESGVAEYWVIDPRGQRVFGFSQSGQGRFAREPRTALVKRFAVTIPASPANACPAIRHRVVLWHTPKLGQGNSQRIPRGKLDEGSLCDFGYDWPNRAGPKLTF